MERIDDVLERLDEVVDRARRDGDRVGLFAVLYRGVTAGVKEGIAEGRFRDGARMERLDVLFAKRYLDALEARRRGERCSRCWEAAFAAARSRRPLILQHLLLGINAHINLDLGIAAARTAPGAALPALREDFDAINHLLGERMDQVQDRISRVSPWMGVLDRAGHRKDETVFGWSLRGARDCAWRAAVRLAPMREADRPAEIERMDRAATALSLPIRSPGPSLLPWLLLVRSREPGDVGRIMEALS